MHKQSLDNDDRPIGRLDGPCQGCISDTSRYLTKVGNGRWVKVAKIWKMMYLGR
jgi:hypothetical protein